MSQRKKQLQNKNKNQRSRGRGRQRGRTPRLPQNMRQLQAPVIYGNIYRPSKLKFGRFVTFSATVSTTRQFCNAIPMHPAFHRGAMQTLAQSHASFRLHSARLVVLPTVGTGTGGVAACCHLPRCNPISNEQDSAFGQIVSAQGVLWPVWQPHVVEFIHDRPNFTFPMVPTSRDHVPANFYMATTSNVLSDRVQLVIELTVEPLDPVQNVEVYTKGSVNDTFTSSDDGLSCEIAHAHASVGVVVDSTVQSIDIGEFVNLPAVANFSSVDINLLHNGVSLNYEQAQDLGDFHAHLLFLK